MKSQLDEKPDKYSEARGVAANPGDELQQTKLGTRALRGTDNALHLNLATSFSFSLKVFISGGIIANRPH